MQAIGRFIIIDEIKESIKKTSGGLELAEKHREDLRYRKATIVSLGAAVEALSSGDTIMFDRVAGHELENGYKVIQDRDVVARL